MSNTPTNLHPIFDNIFKSHFPVMYETLPTPKKPAETMIECVRCGFLNNEISTLCTDCGYSLEPAKAKQVQCYVCSEWYSLDDPKAYSHAKGRC